MNDPFKGKSSQVGAPPRNGFEITPNDGADLPNVVQSIYVGQGGDIAVLWVDEPSDANVVTFRNANAGSYIIGQFRRVMATGTTALNLIGS